ncbi:hypothetical protein [Paenibacillus sp. J2TS4]|uniref:hypothetical protein n=1 Tax=Paenibacillus sp. J2TS4 TaxID=2807194 RepID=UPI001AFE1F2B|nr:hypothetical protein [Paenibacillus sp. J2TS4]GIP32984.1 hypothetical protein J2TS4_21940 [Paenibacillus sp. J2TS4]
MSKAPLETKEDLELVKEYILLPLLLDALEHDIALMERIQLKMAAFYVGNLRGIQIDITTALTLIRQQMRIRGIKVYEQQRTRLGIEARYLCRGYHHTFAMLWSLVKAELTAKLSLFFGRKCGK